MLYDTLESSVSLPGSGICISRFNASLLRKSRPSRGLNVGVVYLTKTHLVFFAHFVVASQTDKQVSLPLRSISTVRKMWYGRLFPNGVLVRRKRGPDYLVVLADKDKQKEVAGLVNAMVAEAKELESDESKSTEEYVPDVPRVSMAELEEEEPGVEQVRVRTMKSAKFAHTEKKSGEGPHQAKGDEVQIREVRKNVVPTATRRKVLTGSNPETREKHGETHAETSAETPQQAHQDFAHSDHSLHTALTSAIASVQNNVETDRQQESLVFCVSAFILMFTTVGVCVALYLLQLRISVIGSHLAAKH